MLRLLSKRSLNCFTGISLVHNIQYIRLFVCNLYNIPQEPGQRRYYRNCATELMIRGSDPERENGFFS